MTVPLVGGQGSGSGLFTRTLGFTSTRRASASSQSHFPCWTALPVDACRPPMLDRVAHGCISGALRERACVQDRASLPDWSRPRSFKFDQSNCGHNCPIAGQQVRTGPATHIRARTSAKPASFLCHTATIQRNSSTVPECTVTDVDIMMAFWVRSGGVGDSELGGRSQLVED